MRWLLLLFGLLCFFPTCVWTLLSHGRQSWRRRHRTRRGSIRACICINCKWVDRCTAYHFVETKHEQPHLTAAPDFTPRAGSPQITVSIRREDEEGARVAWDAVRDETTAREETEAQAQEPLLPQSEDGAYDRARHLETADFSIPTFTTEYDVVKCADFVLDDGRWVRLMPAEIRALNPDFVPS